MSQFDKDFDYCNYEQRHQSLVEKFLKRFIDVENFPWSQRK